MSEQAIQHVQEVKRRHEQTLMRKANVVAVGIGFQRRGGQITNEVCIVVSVKTKVALTQLKQEDIIPSSIEGVPVDVVETGTIKAL
jgi:predicted nucleotidyltransferase